MKKIIKRIVGAVIILHIFPVGFIVITMLKGTVNEYGYLAPYIIGLLVDVFCVLAWGMYRFLDWCFDW